VTRPSSEGTENYELENLLLVFQKFGYQFEMKKLGSYRHFLAVVILCSVFVTLIFIYAQRPKPPEGVENIDVQPSARTVIQNREENLPASTISVADPPAMAGIPEEKQMSPEVALEKLWSVLKRGRYRSKHPQIAIPLNLLLTHPDDEVLAMIANINDYKKKLALLRVVSRGIGENSPLKVMEMIAKLKQEDQPNLTRSVLDSWGKVDAEKAFSWFVTENHKDGFGLLGGSKTRGFLAGEVLLQLENKVGLSGAIQKADSIQPRSVASAAIDLLLSRTPQSLIEELSLSDSWNGEVRAMAYEAIGKKIAKADSLKSVAWFHEQSFNNDREQFFAAQGVAKVWMQKNPRKAADWWLGNTAENSTGRVMAGIVEQWDSADLFACGDWLNSQNLGSNHDQVRLNYARRISDLDPEAATQWVETISNDLIRDAALIELGFRR